MDVTGSRLMLFVRMLFDDVDGEVTRELMEFTEDGGANAAAVPMRKRMERMRFIMLICLFYGF